MAEDPITLVHGSRQRDQSMQKTIVFDPSDGQHTSRLVVVLVLQPRFEHTGKCQVQ